MSRSRDATSLTTRSPILISPSEMSSSPATMRSAVVFPHPEGPTSTMNSPSRASRVRSDTARVPSGKTFATSENSTSATVSGLSLPLRSRLRQARAERAEGEGEHERRREARQRGADPEVLLPRLLDDVHPPGRPERRLVEPVVEQE